MVSSENLVTLSRAGERRARADRWQLVRDLLGGALLLATWLALWTVTWAAIAGPLSPAGAERPAPPPPAIAGV